MPRTEDRGRRSNGEGNIYHRKDTGIYEGKVTLGRNPLTGRWDRRTVTGKTRGDVIDKMNRLRGEHLTGQLADPRGWTFGAYLDHWLEHKKPQIKPTTYHAYESALAYLKPLSDYPLSKVGPYEVDCVTRDLMGRGVSPTYVRTILTTLSSAGKQAVRWGLLPRNWAEDTARPKAKRIEQTAWTQEEMQRFVKAAEPTRLYALFYVALTTGMRRGELLGLHWSDIRVDKDKMSAIIDVRRNVVEPEQELIVQETKTSNSRRRIRVGRDTVGVLEAPPRERQLLEMATRAWSDANIVFASEVGTYIRPRNIYRSLKGIIKDAKVPDYGLHGLRRTHASLLIRAGVDLKEVSRRLGHYDPSFTAKVYQHIYADQEERGAIQLSDLIVPTPTPAAN